MPLPAILYSCDLPHFFPSSCHFFPSTLTWHRSWKSEDGPKKPRQIMDVPTPLSLTLYTDLTDITVGRRLRTLGSMGILGGYPCRPPCF